MRSQRLNRILGVRSTGGPFPSGAYCPVCYGKETSLLYEVSNEEAAQHFILREADSARFGELAAHIESLWGSPVCRVLKCTRCSFCFACPFVAGDKLFYSLAYERTGYPSDKWEYNVTCDFLADRIRHGRWDDEMTLLEVGAGDGAFVKRISPRMIRKDRILTTEYSRYGAGEIRKAGMRCIELDIRELTGEEFHGAFGILCLFQILEHLDDLDGLFHQLNFLGRKDGLLFISVPSDAQIAYNEQHGALLDMPPNHIGRWSKTCFDIMGRRHGWSLLEHRYQRERLLPLAKRFLIYRYLRMTQVSGSWANRIRSMRRSAWHRLLEIALLGAGAPLSFPHLMRMKRCGIGDSQWVCFQREA